MCDHDLKIHDAAPSACTWFDDHLYDLLGGLERKCFAAKSQALRDLVVVKIFPQVRISMRLTFWNARSRPEGDDIGIQLLNLLVELHNEALEVMDGWRKLEFRLSPRQRFVSMRDWCLSCKIELRSWSLNSLEKGSERLQLCQSSAKATLSSRDTSLPTPRGLSSI